MDQEPQDQISLNYPMIELTFPASKFMSYLASVGRVNKCPLCPHEGEWVFFTEIDGDDPNMLVYKLPQAFGPADFTPCALMECPRCGFLVHTSLINVHAHFQIGGPDEP
ncbi:MAG: hypothetical protein ABWY06_05270 [Pseudomonas sp.]|uniref:hypothetical protein n=1 Tax=Pseudomonas sp. TaxID=306 RepID=UPI003390D352